MKEHKKLSVIFLLLVFITVSCNSSGKEEPEKDQSLRVFRDYERTIPIEPGRGYSTTLFEKSGFFVEGGQAGSIDDYRVSSYLLDVEPGPDEFHEKNYFIVVRQKTGEGIVTVRDQANASCKFYVQIKPAEYTFTMEERPDILVDLGNADLETELRTDVQDHFMREVIMDFTMEYNDVDYPRQGKITRSTCPVSGFHDNKPTYLAYEKFTESGSYVEALDTESGITRLTMRFSDKTLEYQFTEYGQSGYTLIVDKTDYYQEKYLHGEIRSVQMKYYFRGN